MAIIGGFIRLVWVAARIPALAVLAFLAPVVSLVMGGVALLCFASAAAWALEGRSGGMPAHGLLACALAAIGLQRLYRALLRLMSV